MRQYWIEGVLEKSLFQAILLDLGMARMVGAVDSPFGTSAWGEVVEWADGESQPLPPEQNLADLYDEEGGSLLVLGEPGSGKTTSLLELAHGLLLRAEADARRPPCWNWRRGCCYGPRPIRDGLCRWSSISPPGWTPTPNWTPGWWTN